MHNQKHPFDDASPTRRRGFTLIELTVAAAILAVLIAIVMQCISVSFRERARAASRHAATELAANLLEAARGQPFDKLDKTWADAQVIPTETAALLSQGKVAVTIDSEKGVPNAKRITAQVQWRFEEHLPMQRVQMTTIIGPRET